MAQNDYPGKKQYPKMLYRISGGNLEDRTVNTPEEHAALGEEWAESPDEAKQKAGAESASKR